MTEKEVIEFLQKPHYQLSHPYEFYVPYELDYSNGCYKGCYTSEKYAYKFDLHDETAEVEYQNYLTAVRMGAARILLPTEKIGTNKYGVTIYRQPKFSYSDACVDGICFKKDNLKCQELNELLAGANISDDTITAICHEMYECYRIEDATLWLKRAVQLYGVKFMYRFAEWTNECEVDDLHLNNIGWIGNYRPIVLDYGGTM